MGNLCQIVPGQENIGSRFFFKTSIAIHFLFVFFAYDVAKIICIQKNMQFSLSWSSISPCIRFGSMAVLKLAVLNEYDSFRY